MVGLPLAPPKVARRAVRILVLTVRFATARRRATPPCVAVRNRAVPRTHRSGELSVLDRRGVGFPIRHSTHGERHGTSGPGFTVGLAADVGIGRTGRARETIKDGGGVGATCTMAVSRGDSRASPRRAGPHRRAGTVTAPTRFLSGGRRKPPWSRTELGEWSPRDEKSVYNRSGREDLQSRASDREQVVRLGPLAWISNPRLAGSSHPARASPAVPQGAWNALGRPRGRGLS